MQISRKTIGIVGSIAFIGLGIVTLIMVGLVYTGKDKSYIEKTVETTIVKEETTEPVSTAQQSEDEDELQKMKDHHFFTLANPNMRIVNDILEIDNKYQNSIFTSSDNPQNINLRNTAMPTLERINNICEKNNLIHGVDGEQVLTDLKKIERKYATSGTVYYTNIIEYNGFLYNFMLNFAPHYETKKFLTYYMNYTENNFGEWKNEHGYIQYLFPGMYMSSMAPEKILLQSLACELAKSEKYRHF